MSRKITLAAACAQFVNRYTVDHVPAWALKPCEGNGKFYAPQFASDAEWYANTKFYGEEGHIGRRNECYTSGQTWPLGQWLDAPYTRVNEKDLALFTRGYETALYWSSSDTVEGEDVNLDGYPTSTASDDKCRADCRAFFTANQADIYAAAEAYPTREEHGGLELAGHDFALTRNGHGAGYWDGDLLEELGERLTAASKAAGETTPYLGDDGLIYQ